MDILYFGMNGYNLVFLHNQLRRYGGVILLQIGEADVSSPNVHPCTFGDGEFFLVQKRRCCVEPPPSMAEATPQMPHCVQKQEPVATLFVMEDKNYARERAAKRSPTAQAGILL